MNGGIARLAAAAAGGLAAYAALAWATRGGGAGGTGAGGGAGGWGLAGWLIGAQAAGWLALGLAWRVRNEDLDTRAAGWIVVAGAVLFRLCGLGTAPGWEDDYFRHLWDGWVTWRTGSPYGVAPLEWFGAGGLPARMEAVLDGINHPEHATIYGPVAQAWAALAEGLARALGADGGGGGGGGGEGGWGGGGTGGWGVVVFKAGLEAAEEGGLWALARLGGRRALLLAAWCPLAVTEIAFAGHVDALAMAAVAGALLAAARGRPAVACGWVAAACATKAYALVLAPFFLWRGGWRGAAWFAAVAVAAYAPWVAATVAAGRGGAEVLGVGGLGAMAGAFEFNSSGYAVLVWALGEARNRVTTGKARNCKNIYQIIT